MFENIEEQEVEFDLNKKKMGNYYLKSFDNKINFDSYYLNNQASNKVSGFTQQFIKNYQFGSGLGNNLLQ